MTDTATETAISRPVRQRLETLTKIGTPPQVLGTLEHFARRDVEIRSHQFRPEKERVQLVESRDHTIRELAAYPTRVEQEAAAERDQELKRVDAEIAQARVITPRQMAETDSEYTGRMLRQSITETRDLAAITASAADVSLALASDDPDVLTAIVREALEDGHPERIRRVGRAAESKLGKLAGTEMANSAAPGAPAPAFLAAESVRAQLREWRARESEKSPLVRRQRITAKYETRVVDARRAVADAANLFGMKEDVERGLAGASQFVGR